jgi:protein SCO1/2
MSSLRVGLSLLLLSLPAAPTLAQDAPPPPYLKDVRIEQKLADQTPLDLVFKDENGVSVRFGDLVRDKPVILTLVYYECPMLCTMVLNDLGGALKMVPFDVGREFDIVTVSFDPRETPALARPKKDSYVRQYGRAGAERGWHFLTGDQAAITALTDAVGFHYVWDEATKQFAHASGFVILAPGGKITRYFYGHNYTPSDLRLSLVEASEGKIGSPADVVMLYCFQYDPARGKYSLAIMNILRAAALLTLGILGGFMIRSLIQERRKNLTG